MNIFSDINFKYTPNDFQYTSNDLDICDIKTIDYINQLIHIEEVDSSLSKNKKDTYIQNCYIHPDIFCILDKYSNKNLEYVFSYVRVPENSPFFRSNVPVNSLSFNSNKRKQKLLINIIIIAVSNENFTYLDYLIRRNINLFQIFNSYLIYSTILDILLKNHKFYILQKLINYGICLSITKILYAYLYDIHMNVIVYQEDDEINNNNYQYNNNNYRVDHEELNLLNKNVHIKNIKYLIDIGASLNYTERCDPHCSIINMLTDFLS